MLKLDSAAVEYQELLSGSPQTVSMESGLVIVSRSKPVETHSTKKYEEVLVVLSGSGTMQVTGGSSLSFKAPCVVYCPPFTEHSIVNTGTGLLKYVYVASKALP